MNFSIHTLYILVRTKAATGKTAEHLVILRAESCTYYCNQKLEKYSIIVAFYNQHFE
jgi:hypothetical protein